MGRDRGGTGTGERLVKVLLAGGLLVALDTLLPRAVNPYVLQVLMLCGINMILAVCLNLINGFTGQFSIGHAGFMAVGGYASAVFTLHVGRAGAWPIWPRPPACPAPWLTGACFLVALVLGGLAAARRRATWSASPRCGCAATTWRSSRSASARSSA